MDSKGEKSAADHPAVPGLSRKDIFLLIKNQLNDGAATAYEEIEKAMSEKLQRPFTLSGDVKCLIRKLLSKFNDKWKNVSRHEDKFLEKFSEWLSVFVPFEQTPEDSEKSSNMGRPSLEFSKASERTKRRKTEELRAETSTEELSYAVQMSLRESGKSDAGKVVQDVTLGGLSKAKQYRESIGSISESPLSPDAALSVIVETNLSKSQYQKIRNASRENCSTLFPSYNKVHQAKLKCYPTKSDISIRFQDYALQTARDFVHLYPWYHMPTTVHKVLIRGAQIINSALLPIGQMSEDAQESSNKYIKKYRTDFVRKCSRVKTMEDLFARLLSTSDPYISSLRKLPCKKIKSLLLEALQLLTAPSISTSEESSSYFTIESTDCESSDFSDDDY